MAIWTVALFYVAMIAFFLWLLYRFIGLADDVRYLANRKRIEAGDELPKANRTVTIVIIVVAVLMLVYAFALMAPGLHL